MIYINGTVVTNVRCLCFVLSVSGMFNFLLQAANTSS